MVLAERKLSTSIEIFEKNCSDIIIKKELNLRMKRVKFQLVDGIVVYIQYNNYGQYSYSVIFSSHEQDLCRFDNYDDHWPVASAPHHFHQRGVHEPKSSEMIGVPDQDIPKLTRFLLKNLK